MYLKKENEEVCDREKYIYALRSSRWDINNQFTKHRKKTVP